MRMQTKWVAVLVVVLAMPALQGAGCRSHYSAHVKGTIVAPNAPAAQVRVLYRQRMTDTTICATDWVPCLRDGTWQPLHKCNGKPSDPIIILSADQQHSFDACTGMIGVDYTADFLAFRDENGDGVLGSGERYGLWAQNPMTRDREKAELRFELDQVMP